MQAPRYPWKTAFIRSGRPTVGNLMELCEENYFALLRLVPELRELRGELCSVVDRDQDLFLEVLEQAPYTTLLARGYRFSTAPEIPLDPAAKILAPTLLQPTALTRARMQSKEEAKDWVKEI